MDYSIGDWLIIGGLAALWFGPQILAVGNLPRQLRKGQVPSAPKGTTEAFGLFWMDQYGYIGLSLVVVGAILLAAGIFL